MFNLGNSPVFIFGAGATKACGGPLTAEILPDAFSKQIADSMGRKDLASQLDECLVEHFHVPPNREDRHWDDYPPLPLLLSLLDLAIERDRPLVFTEPPGGDRGSVPRKFWNRERLVRAREAVEYIIFAVLNEHLRSVERNWYGDLFAAVHASCVNPEPRVISLNYDILLDNVLFRVAQDHCGDDARPTYASDIQTPAYRNLPKEYGQLLKLHGSLNWLYCPSCRRLEIGMSDCGRNAVTCKVLDVLYKQAPLEKLYAVKSARCRECRTPLRAVIITPTRAKDYRNPHIQRIWYEAERCLRKADHAVFIGYSLPDDDIEVLDLLRRGLEHLRGSAITVVEYDDQHRSLAAHPVGRRYRSLFGNDINWDTSGFGAWVQCLSASRILQNRTAPIARSRNR